MMKCIKEKNFINFQMEGIEKVYRLDINTGIFYGLNGKPVKTCPKNSEMLRASKQYFDKKNILKILFDVFSSPNTAYYMLYANEMQIADKLDSLNIFCLDKNTRNYNYINENIDFLVRYVKVKDTDAFYTSDFKEWLQFEELKLKYGNAIEGLTFTMFSCLTTDIQDLTTKELSVCTYYLIKGKFWEYHEEDLDNLYEYILMCRKMNKVPEKTSNFMREYCETKKTYLLFKTEFDNKQIIENYTKQSKAWEFEDGEFIIKIPQSGKDLIDEGKNMHHCVGGYIDSIVNGSTYICFVRKKENPDKGYITCQVRPYSGEIGQYYLSNDRYISKEQDIEFKNKFQEYLYSVWKQ